MQINYSSKEGQDKWVLETLSNKTKGIFVDIGAHDGVDDSNSYCLEKYFGWSGLCVEANPNPKSFPRLQSNRSCISENCAVFDRNGFVDFAARTSRAQTCGIYSDDFINEHTIKQVQNKSFSVIQVPCYTLEFLLEKHSLPNIIDYLSLDVEGAELNILKCFNFNKYKFRTLTIEHGYNEKSPVGLNIHNKNRKEKIKDLLIKNGYSFVKTCVCDDFFVKKDLL